MENNDIEIIENENNIEISNALMSPEISKLALAMSQAQSEYKHATKDKVSHHGTYATLASCIDATKESFGKHGISVLQPVVIENKQPFLVTLIVHSSGQWIQSRFPLEHIMPFEKGRSSSIGASLQQLGVLLTYLRRYLRSALIGLAQEDDEKKMLEPVPNPKSDKAGCVNQEKINYVNQFMKLCGDNKVDVKEFSAFNKVNSKDLDSVINAITNFDQLKELYEKSTSNA